MIIWLLQMLDILIYCGFTQKGEIMLLQVQELAYARPLGKFRYGKIYENR